MNRGIAFALCAGLLACVAPVGGWDLAAFEAAHPSVAQQKGHRLGDTAPYFEPAPGQNALDLFLCRWSGSRALRVSLPPDASDSERDVLRLALSAWEDALPVRFELSVASRPDIEIRFVPEPEEPELRPAGDTVADCALFESEPHRLVFASIWLNRVLYDVAGRPSSMTPEELLGTVLHELGHALGYSGHARDRDSIMSSRPGEVRRLARRVLAGRPLEAPTLVALYSVPSGSVVGRLALPEARLSSFVELRARAHARGLLGPYVRVGDESARLLWRRSKGEAAGSLIVRSWRRVLDDPSRFELTPTPRARVLLAD